MKDYLESIKQVIIDKSDNYLFYQKVLENIYEYYIVKDLTYNSLIKQAAIFKRLYISKENVSCLAVAKEFGINRKTLYKYRLEFNNFAIKIEKMLKDMKLF